MPCKTVKRCCHLGHSVHDAGDGAGAGGVAGGSAATGAGGTSGIAGGSAGGIIGGVAGGSDGAGAGRVFTADGTAALGSCPAFSFFRISFARSTCLSTFLGNPLPI
ncbi:MAG: hypothetical protein O8C67_06135 [Candidatus Methanoperedens sp.]|nr:hypothetical protein [Candidatus Methanoperedens sp.]